MSLKQDIQAKIVELSALVDSIVEPVDPSEQIAQLTAQVASLQADVAAKEVIIADQGAKLAEMDLLAKRIDAIQPDA